MHRRIIVLRPEPGNTRTAVEIRALGIEAVALPLFAIEPVAWTPPDPARFDALLLTSANASRHAGTGLAALAGLPVVAVGGETAAAARELGLDVAATGIAGVEEALALAEAAGLSRLLHLAGRDRIEARNVDAVVVYASNPVGTPLDRALIEGSVVLLHSARAARRFAALVDCERLDRATIRIVAISDSVRVAAGDGWAVSLAAMAPDRLVASAADLAIDRPAGAGDKAA